MTVTVTHMWMIVFFVTIDYVPANIPKSSRLTKLYFFDDNAAAIRIIRKGRSPNWRHVTRTHTVVLNWLCERINLDSSFFIRYVRTSDQMADMLTKGAFNTLQWDHLLHLWQVQSPNDHSVARSHFTVLSSISLPPHKRIGPVPRKLGVLVKLGGKMLEVCCAMG